jgi:hypothetical protein
MDKKRNAASAKTKSGQPRPKPKPAANAGLCHQFVKDGTCRYAEACKFKHSKK